MVHHQKKQDSGDLHRLLPFLHSGDHHNCFLKYRKSASPALLLLLLLLFSLFSFAFILAAALLLFPPSPSSSSSLDHDPTAQCSSVPADSLCCDRTAVRSDVCFLNGDVRTSPTSNSIFLVTSQNSTPPEERIRPYTRKWEANIMGTIDELRLLPVNESGPCDVRHDVPAVFFSTGGYTGNVYHEFNDGIIPLYITSHRFNRRVVFVILEYHDWWISKYGNIIAKLSDFAPIGFSNEKRTHCFPEAIVGLRIHDELAIDPSRMANNRTIRDFRRMLDEAYRPRIQSILQEEEEGNEPMDPKWSNKLKLVIVSRNGSRGIENEPELAKLAESVGFQVQVLTPTRTTELAKIYLALNSSDMMIGVHGAAMTHLLFMRPGTVFLQIVPLGTDWAAEAYYGEPAVKLGLKYMRYAVLPTESSLYREYEKDDPVLRDPESVNAKGWEVTKKVYLDGQNVRLDLRRFRKRLVRAHQYLVGKQSIEVLKKQR